MQRLKGLGVLIPFILSGIMILTGCGQEEASGGVTDVTDALFLSENETEEPAKTSSGETAATAPVSEIAASQEQGNAQKARKLSDEECRQLQEYINDVGNYGFLLSVYEKPQDLNAEQVFFTGAGLDLMTPTEEEREAYMEETGEEDTVNLFGMGAQQVSDYLQYKAGVSLDELTHQPGWTYLEDYDTYYQCHGDEETNICEFEVTDAAVQGDYYRVHYRARRYAGDLDGWHIPVYEAILKRNGDNYRFCANRLWLEKDLLLAPYCEVETEGFGKVKFCAYKPDRDASENADVDFCFVKDSDVLCRLDGMDSRNIRKDMIFQGVTAVDLGDYDGDGMKEIVTICEYEITGEGRPDGREARFYRFDEDAIPHLDAELTGKINSSVTEMTLSGIAHFVKTGADREKFGGRMEAYAAEVAEADPDSYDRFALIYVNDDRFPELLEWGTSVDKGAKIVFYRDGGLQETKVSSAFSYLNKENLLLSRSGTGNLFTDQIYVYTGSRFEVYQSGTFGTTDAAVTAYTKAGKPEYNYKWEGSTVSEAGYHDALVFIYDEEDAIDATKIEMQSADEFLQRLKK
ncbi:MAG: hypothetical protein K6G34_03035 [Lachnospiraceae bacterium]|nr:hypothetical protein [Lachnospiraceae bacterium]